MAEHYPIYLTGASGYLGSHIRALADVHPVRRNEYADCRGRVVIHCAAIVPHTEVEAADVRAATESVQLVVALLTHDPAFVVFPSTRETQGAYAAGKRVAERVLDEHAARVIRFPGLFGSPRRHGLVYNAARAILAGQSFHAAHPLPDWTCMPVTEAAVVCIRAAHDQVPGLTVARNQAIEDFLQWVRA